MTLAIRGALVIRKPKNFKILILKTLFKPRLKKEIKELTENSDRANMKRALRELEKDGMTTCISNAARGARVYCITEKGIEYLKEIEREEIKNVIEIAKRYNMAEENIDFFRNINIGEIYRGYLHDAKLKEMGIDWDAYAFVIDSKTRQIVLKALEKYMPKTIREIRQKIMNPEKKDEKIKGADKITFDRLRKILKDFSEKRLVQAVNKKHKRRFFTITEKGERILGVMI